MRASLGNHGGMLGLDICGHHRLTRKPPSSFTRFGKQPPHNRAQHLDRDALYPGDAEEAVERIDVQDDPHEGSADSTEGVDT